MKAITRPVVPERLETLVLARLSTAGKKVPSVEQLAKHLRRYAPTTLGDREWGDLVSEALKNLQDARCIDAKRRVMRTDPLRRHVGDYAARRWTQWSERALPALGLGIRPDDARSHARLAAGNVRDAWSAAIAGRVLGLWVDGPPPSHTAICDALTWRELGLTGAPKRCPPEIRARFLRDHVVADPGPFDRLLRLLAARAVGAPRSELAAIRIGLVLAWLTGREIVAQARPIAAPTEPGDEPSLIETVRSVAHDARDGVFGDRKVFISSVWHALRAIPPWSALELDDFKARLVAAHRKRELVLARADLVAAMDPTLVASSETRTDGATFHFIVREPVQ